MSIEVRRGADRFVTRESGNTTYHSFSYGRHYDPANVGFGPLGALNDERLPAGGGYAEHPHAHTTIVTWVLSGTLHHTDSLGDDLLLPPGSVAVTRTGTGITHAERATDAGPVRFLQSMVRPDDPDEVPAGLHVMDPDGFGEPLEATLLPTGCRLLLGTLAPGRLALPDAALVHLFVVEGHLVIGDREVGSDDAARLTGQGGRVVDVEEPSRLAVWAFATG